MVKKSKIEEAFEEWWKKDQESQGIMKAHFSIAYLEKKVSLRAWEQSRIDLAENIHVALTFAECGLKDKDYALKLAREIIDKELDDDYWKNR